MTKPPDALLTLLLLAPVLMTGVVAVVLLWPRRTPRRLTEREVLAMCRITAERARMSQWN